MRGYSPPPEGDDKAWEEWEPGAFEGEFHMFSGDLREALEYINFALKNNRPLDREEIADLPRLVQHLDNFWLHYDQNHERHIREVADALSQRGDLRRDPEFYISLTRVKQALAAVWDGLGRYGQGFAYLTAFGVAFWMLIPLIPLQLDDNTRFLAFALLLAALIPVVFRRRERGS